VSQTTKRTFIKPIKAKTTIASRSLNIMASIPLRFIIAFFFSPIHILSSSSLSLLFIYFILGYFPKSSKLYVSSIGGSVITTLYGAYPTAVDFQHSMPESTFGRKLQRKMIEPIGQFRS